MPFKEGAAMKLIDGIPVWGTPEEKAVQQIQNCRQGAVGVALMADHHLGYAVPIGGVVAYEGKISPSGVGFDIACGNKAVLLDVPATEVKSRIKPIMDDIFTTISFGVGRKNNERVDHELFDDPAWKSPEIKGLKSMAQSQLGTVGSGNHYVDLFIDERERVWCGVHFGSRGLGHKLATRFLHLAGGKDGMMVDPAVIDAEADLGVQYLEAMHLAGRYAYAGRDWVCAKVASLLGARIVEEVHNHHNFAWKEQHGGKDLWVVRKGATPAFPGQRGFVGGSMGDISVIVEGIESPSAQFSFSSTVHGAGRVLGRMEAKGRFQKDDRGKKQRLPGKVRHDDMMKWVAEAGVELRGADLDEAPQCYKRLPEVLEAHSDSIRILHTLKPIGVAMAGKDVGDPYKD
jgi:tRNA-splicing ligase RtcB